LNHTLFRYSLSALLEYLDVTLPPDGQAHRALDDADATRQLFGALLNQARRLDSRVVKEVSQISRRTSWPLGIVFSDLSRERAGKPPAGSLGQQLAAKGFMGEAYNEGGLALMQPATGRTFDPPLKPNPTPTPLDIEELCRMLENGGLFANQFRQFEYRPQQVDMLANVTEALNNGRHMMIEAGTGTGKSVAYLIPAIYWAVQNEERVVISTNTINLQDQLIDHDIPMLQQVLPITFKAVTLKGRSNYVCPRRVQLFQNKGSHSHRELRMLAKIMVWQPSTTTGDREELFMPDYTEQALWSQVASDPNICTARVCSADSCFYARARREAESAHIIVVNHALLLADIGVDNRIIPEYNHLIIDEAHHLEDAVTNQLSFVIDQKRFIQFLRELSQPLRGSDRRIGFVHEIARLSTAVVPDSLKDDVNDLITRTDEVIDRLAKYTHQMFQALQSFISDFPDSSGYNPKIRLTEPARNRSAWSNVEMEWENVDAGLKDASQAISILHTMMTELESYDVPNWEELLAGLTSYQSRLDEIRGNLKTVITPSGNDRILWVEQEAKSKSISLNNAPLHVGPLVQEYLFRQKESVVLTSATIRTSNSFEYFQERLDLWDTGEAAVGSPFDYEENTLLFLPTDIPEPNHPGYQRASSQALIELAKQVRGRTLVLFTSYSQLRQTANAIKGALAEANIVVYQQGDGSSRRQMIENFKNADQAILLGTRSFWEGVDIPGPALSCVVITRIPFAVPSDPIVSARSETFENAFAQYSIPQAILAFRQGFGRLIRTKADRGVVVIFDRRTISKSYGHAFLESLPAVTEYRGPLSNLPAVAENWIDFGGIA
jgi:ATP-dependent DNA helicase DinG